MTEELKSLLAKARIYWDSLSREEQDEQLRKQARSIAKAESENWDEGTRCL